MPPKDKPKELKPPMPPPLTMRKLIEDANESAVATRVRLGDFERQLERMVDRMSDKIDHERRESKEEIDRLERTVRSLQSHAEQLARANEFLAGRMRTLEQVANIKPLGPIDVMPTSPFQPDRDTQWPLR